MVIKTKTTNRRLFGLISTLKKLGRDNKVEAWSIASKELSRVRRNRVEINLWELEKKATGKEVVVVPGKVLGEGEFNKKLEVVAYAFSVGAEKAIKKAGGKIHLLDTYAPKNPKQKVELIK